MNRFKEYKKLVLDYPILTEQMSKKRLLVILRQLETILSSEVSGDITEFGCYNGTTSLFIRRLMNKYSQLERSFHVYDSFSGLPAKTIQDASVAGSDFKAGELKASKRDLVRNFKKASLIPPTIHKAWFSDLDRKAVPETIAFAFLDGDFYQSIIDSLNLVWPKLSVNGQVLVDDYNKSNLPGVSRAVDDFFATKNVQWRAEQNLAIITKHQ